MVGLSFMLLLSLSQLSLCSSDQVIITSSQHPTKHPVDNAILAALETHSDPVAALVSLQPETAAALAEPRLLQVIGTEEPTWMTEGDKLRLRRKGKKFIDITDHADFYQEQVETSVAGKACKLFVDLIGVS